VNRKAGSSCFLRLREFIAFELDDGGDAVLGGRIVADESFSASSRTGDAPPVRRVGLQDLAPRRPSVTLPVNHEKLIGGGGICTETVSDASGATLTPIIGRKMTPWRQSKLRRLARATEDDTCVLNYQSIHYANLFHIKPH